MEFLLTCVGDTCQVGKHYQKGANWCLKDANGSWRVKLMRKMLLGLI